MEVSTPKWNIKNVLVTVGIVGKGVIVILSGSSWRYNSRELCRRKRMFFSLLEAAARCRMRVGKVSCAKKFLLAFLPFLRQKFQKIILCTAHVRFLFAYREEILEIHLARLIKCWARRGRDEWNFFMCSQASGIHRVAFAHTQPKEEKKSFSFFPATTSSSENKRHRFFLPLPPPPPKSFHWEFEIHEKILPEIMIRANLKA